MDLKKGEGVGDFVLLDQLTEDAFMENLKVRYSKSLIYVTKQLRISLTHPVLHWKCRHFGKSIQTIRYLWSNSRRLLQRKIHLRKATTHVSFEQPVILNSSASL